MRFELMYESFFKIIGGIPLTLQVVSISTVLGLALAIIAVSYTHLTLPTKRIV